MVAALVGLTLACLCLMPSVRADTPPLPQLSGPVILTVTGLDPARFPGGQIQFDRNMLQALGAVEFDTSSIWTEGVHRYTGVPLATLAGYLDSADAELTLHALNDYAVKMPATEAEPAAPILAYAMDGAAMPVRDKGPIWVIYPYDAGSQYRTVVTFARSIWQLDRIDVTR